MERERPVGENPFGRRHLLKQVAIAVGLAAVVIAGYQWFASTTQSVIDASAGAPPGTDTGD